MANEMATETKRREYGSGSVYFRERDQRWIGTIEAGWTPKGTRRRVIVSASTERDCRRRLKAKQKEIDSGVVTGADPRTTVKMWSEIWLAKSQHRVRPSTWSAHQSAVKRWIVPSFGNKRIGQITPLDVEDMHDSQRDAGKSEGTMIRTQNVLNRMLKEAVVAGHRVHPGITLMDKPDLGDNPRTAMPLPHALSVLREVEQEPDPSRWVAILLNGMRQGERLGLTWDCVDFENDTIYIRQQLQEMHYRDNKNKHLGFRTPDGYKPIQLEGRWCLVPTKTKAGVRPVPMTKWMKAALLAWREAAPVSPHNLVWCRPDGGPIDPRTDRSEWRRLQDDALVLHPTGRHYDVQEGRHTAITLLKALGVDDKTVELIVGQSRLVQSYVHVDLTAKARKALEDLGATLELGSS